MILQLLILQQKASSHTKPKGANQRQQTICWVL